MAKLIIADAQDLRQTVSSMVDSLDTSGLLRPGARVFLKPNLTYPVHLPGVTTTPAFMIAVMECLAGRGVHLTVGEADGGYGAWSADVAFQGHGLPAICSRFGAQLVNLSKAPLEPVQFETESGTRTVPMPIVLLHESDVVITLPVPKVHSVTYYSGAVKNSWGMIPDSMRLKLHPFFDSLIWAINRRIGPRFVLADAQYMLDESGPIFGKPVFMNRVIAADDIYAFDLAVPNHVMGLDVSGARYLTLGTRYGFSPEMPEISDTSTGPRHKFELRKSMRSRLVSAAFPHQWAVNLLWDSPVGRLAHTAMYAVMGNRIEADRQRILTEASVTHAPSEADQKAA